MYEYAGESVLLFYGSSFTEIFLCLIKADPTSQSAFSHVLAVMLNARLQRQSQFMRFPTTVISRIEQDFYDIANFPNVIGANNCTHSHPLKPRAHLQKTHTYSKNVQVMCDGKLQITTVVAKYHGSVQIASYSELFRQRGFWGGMALYSLILFVGLGMFQK